jgi:hypothetical protein
MNPWKIIRPDSWPQSSAHGGKPPPCKRAAQSANPGFPIHDTNDRFAVCTFDKSFRGALPIHEKWVHIGRAASNIFGAMPPSVHGGVVDCEKPRRDLTL